MVASVVVDFALVERILGRLLFYTSFIQTVAMLLLKDNICV